MSFRWGIIPAAGMGTRIQPLAFSKELLPIGTDVRGSDERPRAISEYLIERMTLAGVDGFGVGADMSSPTSFPASTSTSPAFTDDPPTSKPCILRVMTNNSQICRRG